MSMSVANTAQAPVTWRPDPPAPDQLPVLDGLKEYNQPIGGGRGNPGPTPPTGGPTGGTEGVFQLVAGGLAPHPGSSIQQIATALPSVRQAWIDRAADFKPGTHSHLYAIRMVWEIDQTAANAGVFIKGSLAGTVPPELQPGSAVYLPHDVWQGGLMLQHALSRLDAASPHVQQQPVPVPPHIKQVKEPLAIATAVNDLHDAATAATAVAVAATASAAATAAAQATPTGGSLPVTL